MRTPQMVLGWLLLTATLAAQAPRSVPVSTSGLVGDRPVALDLPDLVVDTSTPGETWVVGPDYKAQVTAAGLVFYARPETVRDSQGVGFHLQQVRLDGELLPLVTAKRAEEPVPAGGATCVLDHGSLVERYALRREGVEQSWTFATLPTRGELVLRVGVATEWSAAPRNGGVHFGDATSGVRYGSATVIDGHGQRLAVDTEWVDGALQIVVPAAFVADATLPLLVDPLVSTVGTVASGPAVGTRVSKPDVSYDLGTDSYLVVWLQTFAANDRDVYARRYSSSWAPIGSAFGIDITAWDWSSPAVAHRAKTNEWLVAGYAKAGLFALTWSVRARLVSALGVPFPAFDLASAIGSQPGVPLVVGGDPYSGPGSTVTFVAWAVPGYIVYATVDDAGVPSTVQSFSATGTPRSLSLSRSNRSSRWLLAWGRNFPMLGGGGTATLYEAVIFDFFGTPVVVGGSPVISLGISVLPVPSEARIAVSSPDLQGWFTVASRRPGATELQKIRIDGTVTAAISMATVSAAWGSASAEAVETDGVRTLALTRSGTDVRGVLLAGDTAAGAWRADEDFTVLGAASVSSVAVTSVYAESLGLAVTPCTIAYSTEDSSSTSVRLVGYRGYASLGGFSTFATACGTPLAISSTGIPAIGNVVGWQLATSHPLVGFVFGAPAFLPLAGVCSCLLGVNGTIVVGNSLSLALPPRVDLVGQTFSTQGFTFESGPCFGSVSLSNTIDMRIQ